MRPSFLFLIITLCLFNSSPARASGVEVFAKGSVSKNYITHDTFTTNLELSTGFAIALFSQVRLEARYTNNGSLQNRLLISSGTVNAILTDIKTSTTIYSLGLDIDFLSEKSWFQPFIFVGAGYVITSRSYYVQPDASTAAILQSDPTDKGVSGNLGLGFRIRLAHAIAFEIEAFAYGINIHQPNPLVNLYCTVGVRFFF